MGTYREVGLASQCSEKSRPFSLEEKCRGFDRSTLPMREVTMTRLTARQLRNLFLLHWSPAAAVAIVTQIYFSSDFGADLGHRRHQIYRLRSYQYFGGFYKWRVVLLATDENVSACPPPQEPANVHKVLDFAHLFANFQRSARSVI